MIVESLNRHDPHCLITFLLSGAVAHLPASSLLFENLAKLENHS